MINTILIADAASHIICSNKFDFILSFASDDQEPAERIGQLPILFTKLLTTTTPVGELVGLYMPPQYLKKHQPVFSSKTFHHVTFVEPSATFPGGRQLVCPDKCNEFLKVRIIKKNGVRKGAHVTCSGCRRRVKVPLPPVGYTITMKEILQVPGYRLVQTPYPIPIATDLRWSSPNTTTTEGSEDLTMEIPMDSSSGSVHISLVPAVQEGGGPSQPSRQRSPVQSEKGALKHLLSPPLDIPESANEEQDNDRGRVEGAVPGLSSATTTQSPSQQEASGWVVQNAPTEETNHRIMVDNPPGALPLMPVRLSKANRMRIKKRLAIPL